MFFFSSYVAVRLMGIFFRRACLLTILFLWTVPAFLSAAEKTSVILTVHDSLTSPNQPATIQATLTRKGSRAETGIGGEPIELLVAGQVAAIAMTGGDGWLFCHIPRRPRG